MCGLGGVVREGGAPIPRRALVALASALRHRGPDDVGYHHAAGVGLAHVRLSIVDPALGRQPMSSEDGRYVLVYNGEVFNHAELRVQLERRGHRFRTRCDTEVVLAGFAEWGAGLLNRLNGQFAFAIHDQVERSLFLARDRFGVRPLFYAIGNGEISFASEPAGLFALGTVEPAPDVRGVAEALTLWGARAPRTVFSGVRALPPGTCASWRNGRLTVTSWYQPDFPPDVPERPISCAAAADELGALLRDAVSLRLRADVEVGAYLSGGLDSSLVCALAQPRVSGRLRTFGLEFEEAALDEGPHQRVVAEELGTVHTRRRIASAEIAHAFPEVVRHAGSPMVRSAAAPMYLLAADVRRRGIKVVLSGEGADELFLGYDLFREAAVRRFVMRRPTARRQRLLGRLYPYIPGPRGDFWRHWFLFAGAPSDPLFSHLSRFHLGGRVLELLSPDVREELREWDPLQELRESLPEGFARWAPSNRAAYLELRTLLEPYLLSAQGDRMSLAHGVEARYPFLDHRLFEFAARLPVCARLSGLREKAVLRRCASGHIPASILARSKQPYRAPDAAAFFGPGAPEWVEARLDPAVLASSGWWDVRAVSSLLARCRAGRVMSARENQALVSVISTQLWHDAYFTGRAQAPVAAAPPRLASAAV